MNLDLVPALRSRRRYPRWHSHEQEAEQDERESELDPRHQVDAGPGQDQRQHNIDMGSIRRADRLAELVRSIDRADVVGR